MKKSIRKIRRLKKKLSKVRRLFFYFLCGVTTIFWFRFSANIMVGGFFDILESLCAVLMAGSITKFVLGWK